MELLQEKHLVRCLFEADNENESLCKSENHICTTDENIETADAFMIKDCSGPTVSKSYFKFSTAVKYSSQG